MTLIVSSYLNMANPQYWTGSVNKTLDFQIAAHYFTKQIVKIDY